MRKYYSRCYGEKPHYFLLTDRLLFTNWNSRIPAVFLYSELGIAIACVQIPGFSGLKIYNSIIIYSQEMTPLLLIRAGPDYKECSNMFGRTGTPHFRGSRTQVSQTFRLWGLSRPLVKIRKTSQNRLVELVCTTVVCNYRPFTLPSLDAFSIFNSLQSGDAHAYSTTTTEQRTLRTQFSWPAKCWLCVAV